MIVNIILISHLILAATVMFGFGCRYFLVFKNKKYPAKGRTSLLIGSISLVISGVALSLVGHLAITSVCLDSLGLVVALLALEYGLQKVASRLARENIYK